ncbi:hypothetical protein STFE110948_06965 [Streptobacillus felis]|uniref:hypothetical protein n=1 Tax=Streptobacillus felis TaxID=1384509 RepID=UPI00083706C5|nr:hypothetical protein [Streptobacillus felis]
MIKIYLNQIAQIYNLLLEIFEEEDSDYVDYRVIKNKERSIDRTLLKITNNKEKQIEIYNIIRKDLFNFEDNTWKSLCDDLRSKGYEITDGK